MPDESSVVVRLRAAGREISLPLTLPLADSSDALCLHRVLRLLPGKRIVGEATWRERAVLAKCFIAEGAKRHASREWQGLQALQAAGLPTPPPIGIHDLPGGGAVVMTAFCAGAQPLSLAWGDFPARPAGDATALSRLSPALALLGRMHRAGLWHADLHPDNFLCHQDRLLIIDGDGVRAEKTGQPLSAERAHENLALFISQLPLQWEDHLPSLWAAYGEAAPLPTRLQELVQRIRQERAKTYLTKTLRECSAFAVDQRFGYFLTVDRDAVNWLMPQAHELDAWLSHGLIYKDGGTCTVGRHEIAGHPVVTKRYNLKNLGHAFSRLWRPTRAWQAWLAAHRLIFYGLPTPKPWLLLEERWGGLRRTAYLVTEYLEGESLLTRWQRMLAAGQLPPLAERTLVTDLFQQLHRLQITHGDLKAHNLIWSDGKVWLIDLDAMVQHPRGSVFLRTWQRDRQRFLRNWPESTELTQWLDAHLPV